MFPKGSIHIVLQVVKGLLVILSWSVFYYLVKVSLFERYKRVYKKEVPRIILMATKFFTFFFAALSIVVFVLGQSVLSIVAFGGLVSAGLAFALGELILDAFSGVILETESPFEVGDWIKTQDGAEGRVVKVNWRTVILENIDEYLIVIPHRKIAQGFTNFSKPQKSYWDSIEITLDHSVPVERAERILRAGVMAVPSIHQQKCDVTATKADESGITYEIRYMVPELLVYREVKHDVIDALTHHLHKYHLRISEVIGEYAISQGGKPYQEESPLTIAHLINQVEIFNGLPKSAMKALSEHANRLFFREGEKIVVEGEAGQSMFLIGEGLVEITISYKDNSGKIKQKKLFDLGFPEYFGEMAMLLNEKRSATVTAMMNTIVYEISQNALKRILKQHPKAFEKLAKQARERRDKNILTKTQMEKLKDKREAPSKGLLANFKKFFR
jgi:small-conductance mechanosensitive channel/CRP-like cAMP-binding protein